MGACMAPAAADTIERHLEDFHVQPQECYAVEDSPNGIHSAYSAGCKVFMVPDLTQPDAELEKFIYKKVESLVALKEYF